MPTFSMVGVVANCFLQRTLELGGGVRADPLIEPLAFAGEIRYVVRNSRALGYEEDGSLERKLIADMRKIGPIQPVVALRLPAVEAGAPEQAHAACQALLELSCSTLTFVTANACIPVALVAKSAAGSFVRMLPPQGTKIWHPEEVSVSHRGVIHSVHVPTFLDLAPFVQAVAQRDATVALLCRLLQVAQQTTREDFRFFHYMQLLEIAADGFKGSLAQQLRSLWDEAKMTSALASIPGRLGVAPPTGKDITDVLVKLRNAMAHEGCLTAGSVGAEYAAFVGEVGKLVHEVRELARIVVAHRAGVGPESAHARFTFGPDGLRVDLIGLQPPT